MEMAFNLLPERVKPYGGHASLVRDVPLPYGDSLVCRFRSRAILFEDGRRLENIHSRHELIQVHGAGRFSHWGRLLVFSASDNSDPRTNGRAYRLVWEPVPVPSGLPAASLAAIAELEERLRAGETPEVPLQDLALLPEPGWRAFAFRRVAEGLYASARYDLADEQMVRAWRLGERDPDVWAQASRWLRARGDEERYRAVTRAAAGLAARRGDMVWLSALLLDYHEWLGELYQRTSRSFHQDESIIGPVVEALAARRLRPPPRPPGGRLRLALVLAAETCRDFSALPEIAVELAVEHSRHADVRVISLASREEVMGANPFFPPLAERLDRAGVPLHFLALGGEYRRLEEVADVVAAWDLDALILACATHWSLLLAGLRPARLTACLGLGEVELFSSPLIDVVFHNTRKPAAEGFGRSVVMCLNYIPASRFIERGRLLGRDELGLPEGEVVIASCARALKYREAIFWWVVDRVLAACPEVHWAMIGIDRAGYDALPCVEAVSRASLERVHFLGWRNDAPAVTGLADLFVDTFPNGGGYSSLEAMHLGIAVVAGRESPLTLFDERVWSPVPEVVREIAAPAIDDEDALAEAIVRLIRSPAERAAMAARGKAEVARLSDPTDPARQMRDVIAEMLGLVLEEGRPCP